MSKKCGPAHDFQLSSDPAEIIAPTCGPPRPVSGPTPSGGTEIGRDARCPGGRSKKNGLDAEMPGGGCDEDRGSTRYVAMTKYDRRRPTSTNIDFDRPRPMNLTLV